MLDLLCCWSAMYWHFMHSHGRVTTNFSNTALQMWCMRRRC